MTDWTDRILDLRILLEKELRKTFIGQDRGMEELLIAMLCGGHVLLEGVPGVGKTRLVQGLASALSLEFRRIQFTPDLLPSDVTGTEMVVRDPATGERSFTFVKGPVFCRFLLADEINRTPPKTQAALLEVMQERQVTVGGTTYPLEEPFLVAATQNPIEQEGTYPLPEAQTDRFLFKIFFDYPERQEETQICRIDPSVDPGVRTILSAQELLSFQRRLREVPVADRLLEGALELVRRTRPSEPDAPAYVKKHLEWGAGPRGGQAVLLGAKGRALLQGRPYVSREDLAAVALPALRHRLKLKYGAQAAGWTPDGIVEKLVEQMWEEACVPASDPDVRRFWKTPA